MSDPTGMKKALLKKIHFFRLACNMYPSTRKIKNHSLGNLLIIRVRYIILNNLLEIYRLWDYGLWRYHMQLKTDLSNTFLSLVHHSLYSSIQGLNVIAENITCLHSTNSWLVLVPIKTTWKPNPNRHLATAFILLKSAN